MHKMDSNQPITIHKPRPFEPLEVHFCFLRGLLRWLMAANNEECKFQLAIELQNSLVFEKHSKANLSDVQ